MALRTVLCIVLALESFGAAQRFDGFIEGSVCDSQHAAIGDARLELTSEGGFIATARSEPSGRFRFYNAPLDETLNLEVNAPGFSSKSIAIRAKKTQEASKRSTTVCQGALVITMTVGMSAADEMPDDYQPISYKSSVIPSEIPLSSRPGFNISLGILRGLVIHKGKRISGARVELVHEKTKLTAKTDANGEFVFYGVLPHEWAVTVSARGYATQKSFVTMTGFGVQHNFEMMKR
jgi:hypothetical protein